MPNVTMQVIDGTYVRGYLNKWIGENRSSFEALAKGIGRSRYFVQQCCRAGQIRPMDLKLICDKTGLDYERATWIKPAEPVVEVAPSGGKYAEDLDVRLSFIEKKLAFIGCKLAEIVEAQAGAHADLAGVLNDINETLKNFAVANRSGSEKLYNQIKYGGRIA